MAGDVEVGAAARAWVLVAVVMHFHNDITSVGSGWRELVT